MKSATGQALGRLLALPSSLADVVFPATCRSCGVPIASSECLCSTCTEALVYVEPDRCQACGRIGRFQPCPGCGFDVRPVEQLYSCFSYGGPIADAIIDFKRSGDPFTARFLARAMASDEQLRSWDIEILLPVPLHPARLRRRGFNQSALLARTLGKILGIPVEFACLERALDTPRQADMPDAKARLDNVKEAFRVARPEKIEGRKVCLVDDVVTTGSTIAACARDLAAAGADKVFAAAASQR
ncbi:MAG: ComF family protein, partial [Deltaproteobacteria bacterium]